MTAEKKSFSSIAIFLTSRGADLFAQNKKNQTPLDLCPEPNLLKLLTKCNHDFVAASTQVKLAPLTPPPLTPSPAHPLTPSLPWYCLRLLPGQACPPHLSLTCFSLRLLFTPSPHHPFTSLTPSPLTPSTPHPPHPLPPSLPHPLSPLTHPTPSPPPQVKLVPLAPPGTMDPQMEEAFLRECMVCSEDKRSVLFAPCGHIVSCGGCAPRVKKCLLCKEHVVERVPVGEYALLSFDLRRQKMCSDVNV